MEILFVSHKYPPTIGGMEKQSFELINGVKKYVKVYVIVYEAGKSKFRFFASLNKRIVSLCQKNPGITIIHYNDGLMAAMCLRHTGYEHLKRTVTLHGLDVVFPNNIYRRSILPEYKNFDRIFAVSTATAQACIERGIPANKISIVNNGVDVSIADCKPRPDLHSYLAQQYQLRIDDKRVLVCMGRAVKRKGFSWLIRHVVPALQGNFVLLIIGPYKSKNSLTDNVIAALPKRLRRVVTLFLGWPADEQNIRKLLTQPGIADKVKHLGKLPFEDILQVLMAADAFIMPNIPVSGDIEGFGLVGLEACLCGTKVFASGIEGITDVITHEKNGYLLPPGKKGIWAKTLNSFIADPDMFDLTSEEIKAYSLAHFSWDKMVQQYLQCFSDITAGSKKQVILQD
jgi:glycosyltransferase involved in cell wall biosynthesis